MPGSDHVSMAMRSQDSAPNEVASITTDGCHNCALRTMHPRAQDETCAMDSDMLNQQVCLFSRGDASLRNDKAILLSEMSYPRIVHSVECLVAKDIDQRWV